METNNITKRMTGFAAGPYNWANGLNAAKYHRAKKYVPQIGIMQSNKSIITTSLCHRFQSLECARFKA